MANTFCNMIRSEVRSYLHSVHDLSNLKFKPVIQMLEDKLQIQRDVIDAQKKVIKKIIKEELYQEMLSRSGQGSSVTTQDEPHLPIQETFYSDPQQVSLVNMLDVSVTNAYAAFCSEKRLGLSQENPGISEEELDKKIEQLWNDLPSDQKKLYSSSIMSIPHFSNTDWAQDDLMHHEREIKTRPRELSLPYRHTNKLPKKARSAYIFYCLKHRSRIQEANSNIAPVDVSRRLGVEWNSLTPEQKEPYKEEEAKDKKRYIDELRSLGLTTDDLKRSSRNSTISASRARSAYIYFCNEKREEMRAQNPHWNTNEVNRALNTLWNRMSDEEKRPFEVSAFDDKDRIRRELERVKQTIKEPVVIQPHKAKRNRRARTSYTLFCKERMAQLRQSNSSIPFGEASKRLADMWKSLSEDQRQMYVEQSRMESEIMNPESSPTERLAYNNFAAVVRRDKPGFSETSLRELTDQKWASMSQSERLKYVTPLPDSSDVDQKANMGIIEENHFTENN